MSVSIKDRKNQAWERYLEEATPRFEELHEYCQEQQRVVPFEWGLIMKPYYRFASRREFTKFPPLYPPLILGGSIASDNEKRKRLLTQIYWCYQNKFMGTVYSAIMKAKTEEWVLFSPNLKEDEINYVTLSDVRKEYANWLGVKNYLTCD
ncbi:hypothetical protein OAP27_02355 [Candidatus Pseudothioglobus singularis]|nr:hypothetical protein [Candidatus Pseudothioglobus singularis]